MKLTERVSLKEKRSFIARLNCSCGRGEYRYDLDNACTDLFGTFFNAMNNQKETKYKHKCTVCGDTKEFVVRYPLEETFDIGIDCPKEKIVEFVSKHFAEKMHEDLKSLGYEESTI